MSRASLCALTVLLITARALAATPAPVTLKHEIYVLRAEEGAANGRAGRLKANADSTSGVYSFVVRARALADTFVLVPPGVAHRLWSEPGELVKVAHLVSLAGIEKQDGSRPPSTPPGDTAEIVGPEQQWISARNNDEMLRVLVNQRADGASFAVVDRYHNPERAREWTAAGRDTAYYVLDGELTVELEDREVKLPVGTFMFLARETRFRSWNAGKDAARVLFITSGRRVLGEMH